MLLAGAIVVFAVSGILAMYVGCFDLNTTAKNINIALSAAQGLMEEMRNASFTDINDYNGMTFAVNNISSSKGVVDINSSNPELLSVTITVCWNQKNRIFGEDRNLNGVLDVGEDVNNNGIMDSPAQITALIANR
jgi:hypothetical protein